MIFRKEPLIYYKKLTPNNQEQNDNLPHIIWAHGWGQTHASLLSLAVSLQPFAVHWLIDFPGFGNSGKPDSIWGSDDYSRVVANWIKEQLPKNATKIWVGHSFGGRIGIHLAANYSELIKGLFLIASYGASQSRSLIKRIKVFMQIKLFKTLKIFIKCFKKQDIYLDWLKSKFGSHDYRTASDPLMRAVLVKVVSGDLSDLAKMINCPTELVYGANDQETPLSMAKSLQNLIKNSTLYIIPRQDHYSILSEGQHQVIYLLKQFINKINAIKNSL